MRAKLPAILLALLLAGGISGLTRASTPAGDARERAKWRLTVNAAARLALDRLEAFRDPHDEELVLITDELTRMLNQHPDRHRYRKDSFALGAGWLAEHVRDYAGRQVAAAADSLAPQSPLPLTVEQVRLILEPDWQTRIAAVTEDLTARHYPGRHAEARRRAVALARQAVDEQMAFPPQTDLNDLMLSITADGAPEVLQEHNHRPAIVAAMRRFAGPAEQLLFEELDAHVLSAAGRMTDEVLRQYQAQLDGTRRELNAVPGHLLAAGDIRDALLRQAERHRSAIKPAPPAPLYVLFTPVANWIDQAARTLETQRLVAFIDDTQSIRLPDEDIRDMLLQDLGHHRRPAASLAAVEKHFQPRLLTALAADYAAGAQPPAAPEYFVKLLQDGAPAAAFQRRWDAAMRPVVHKIRARISDAQNNEHFAALAQDRPLAGAALQKIAGTPEHAPADLAAALALMHLGGYPDMSAALDAPLLEETETAVMQNIRERIDTARQVLDQQHYLLKDLEQEELEQLHAAVSRRQPLEDILAAWRDKLARRWRTHALAGASIYGELLAPVEHELNKTVRQYYDSLSDAARPATDTDPPPEAGAEAATVAARRQDPARPEPLRDQAAEEAPDTSATADSTPAPVEEIRSRAQADLRNAPDAVLVLDRDERGKPRALFIGIHTAAAASFTFQPAAAQSASDELFAALRPFLEDMLHALEEREPSGRGIRGLFRRRTTPTLKFHLVVRSDDLRHRTSLLLCRRIEEFLNERRNADDPQPAVNLEWNVGLTYEPVTR